MSDVPHKRFYPPRVQGLLFNGLGALILFSSSITLFILAMQEQVGSFFAIFLIGSLLLLIPGFFVLYRTYALIRASYTLERDGLRLFWGLRKEEIPLSDIEWMQPAKEMNTPIHFPLFSFPGAIIGHTHSSELGSMEFMASDARKLILLGVKDKVYAISPSDPKDFLRVFKQAVELGSITPIAASSTLPATYLRQVWADKQARSLLLAGAILALTLLVGTSLLIPSRTTISLGYSPDGSPLAPLQASRLLLIPVLNLLIYAVDLIGALFFFRKTENRVAALALWIGSILTSLLLSVALLNLVF